MRRLYNLLLLGYALILGSCGVVTDKQKSEPHPDAIAAEEAARLANEDYVEEPEEETSRYPSVVVGNLEVMTRNATWDGDDTFDWHEAVKVANGFGDGWRLPTKDELIILFDNREKIGGFKKIESYGRESYGHFGFWSSDEFGGNEAWYYSFDIGQCNDDAYDNHGERRKCEHYTHDMPGTYSKKKPKYVRLVRDVSGDDTHTGFDNQSEEVGLLTDPWLVSSSDSKAANITATGSGSTSDEAQRMALRNAIEQAFGAFISSKTEIFNDAVVADQMASVSSGNVKSYEVLNEEQLPDGKWSVVLRALVSVDKLTSFAQAKGVSVEVKGGLFAMNIKQQMLNEQSEMDVVYNMVGQLHEVMQTAFDYEIENGEPKSLDGSNKNWEIPLKVTATANKNMDFCARQLMKTLAGVSLTTDEILDYKKLNKPVFKVAVTYAGRSQEYYLRNMVSMNCMQTLAKDFRFYTQLYTVSSGLDQKHGNEQIAFLRNSHLHGREYTSFGNTSKYTDPTLRLNLPLSGEIIAHFTTNDNRTLDEVELISGYSVKPRGLISKFTQGGYLIKQRTGYHDGIELSTNNIIEFIYPNSPAASIGLEVGDIIMTSDGKEMSAIARSGFGYTTYGFTKKLEVTKRNTGIIETVELKSKKATYGLVVGLCDVGQSYSYSTTKRCLSYTPVTYDQARDIVEGLFIGGHQSWRLPSRQESEEIYQLPFIYDHTQDSYLVYSWKHLGGWGNSYYWKESGGSFTLGVYSQRCGHPKVSYKGMKKSNHHCSGGYASRLSGASGDYGAEIRPVRTFIVFD